MDGRLAPESAALKAAHVPGEVGLATKPRLAAIRNRANTTPPRKTKAPAAADPLVGQGDPSHRRQARSVTDQTGPRHRLVALATRRSGRRAGGPLQVKNVTVMMAHTPISGSGLDKGEGRSSDKLWGYGRVDPQVTDELRAGLEFQLAVGTLSFPGFSQPKSAQEQRGTECQRFVRPSGGEWAGPPRR